MTWQGNEAMRLQICEFSHDIPAIQHFSSSRFLFWMLYCSINMFKICGFRTNPSLQMIAPPGFEMCYLRSLAVGSPALTVCQSLAGDNKQEGQEISKLISPFPHCSVSRWEVVFESGFALISLLIATCVGSVWGITPISFPQFRFG